MMGEYLRVILAQVNTWLVLAGMFVTIVASEVAPLLDDETAAIVAQVAATVVAWIGAAIAIIRRSTEVPASARGVLLPPDHELKVTVTQPGGVSEVRSVR
jgi:hypothetical protein